MGVQTIGELLRDYREAEGLAVRKAAQLADMDPSTLSRIENDRRPPTATQLAVLAEIYGKPLDRLLALRDVSEIRQKYGQTEYFAETLQILNEDSGTYGTR